jgi:hypothetical protein
MELITLGAKDASEMAIIFGVGGGIAIVAITFSTIKSIMITRQRETTKREVAAYVAEGSMTPQDAERILKAGLPEED